jgi:UDP-N-acetylmuramyl pentapeptide phosphotransferase/UDP-N-acetylglucosamine-1-phosphate transferase
MPAAAIVFVTGLLDDLYDLKPWQKLAGQLAASITAFWGGIRILDRGLQDR